MIPRDRVATALGLPADTDALPPGDLPVDRFAERFLGALDRPEGDETDQWTVDLFDHLADEAPDLALDAVLACLDRAPKRAGEIGAGPLDDLTSRSGAEIVGRIEAEVAHNAPLRQAVREVDTGKIEHPFLKARLEVLSRG